MKPDVSVIICTYNRSFTLKRLLLSLKKQTLSEEKFEIIVVDDNSSDNTIEVCNLMKNEFINFKYKTSSFNGGSAYAKNIGIDMASGEYVLFTDDDCIVSNNWIEKMIEGLKHNSIVTGSLFSPLSPYLKLCHNIAQFHAYMSKKDGYINFILGANMGFRMAVIKELGGFRNEQRLAQDMEILFRACKKGYNNYFISDATIIHDPVRNDLMTILRYAVHHGEASILLRNEYSDLLKTPFILKSPFLILMFSPFIAFSVTAGIYINNPYLRKFFWTAPVVYLLKWGWCWGAFRKLKRYNNI